MQSRQISQAKSEALAPLPKVRFAQIMHLDSGGSVASLAETPFRYSDRPSFGPAALNVPQQDNPASWLADQIETIAAGANLLEVNERPILVKAPIAAFAHSKTGAACEAAVIRSKLCPQEICLEFSDAAFSASPYEAANRVKGLRLLGFRVSIDARKAWNAHLSTTLRLTLDTYRINAEKLKSDTDLQWQCEAAAASGITVIAEQARWRDAPWLADFGVEYAIRPKTDA